MTIKAIKMITVLTLLCTVFVCFGTVCSEAAARPGRVKGFKAKGKRISTFDIDGVEELEPTRFPEVKEEPEDAEEEQQEEENLDPDAGKSQQQVIDELSGQLRIFDNE